MSPVWLEAICSGMILNFDVVKNLYVVFEYRVLALTVTLLSQIATLSFSHLNRAWSSGVAVMIPFKYVRIASLSAFGTPTIERTKPELMNKLFQPVTGLTRTMGCSVVTGCTIN